MISTYVSTRDGNLPSESSATSSLNMQQQTILISIVMPCLNEAKTLGICIKKALTYFTRQKFLGEIIVADNGSSDGSIEIAQSLGARIIQVHRRGYGNALLAGISAAKGEFVIMGDSDDSYDFRDAL